MTRKARAKKPKRLPGFDYCEDCGKLSRWQSPMNTAAIASVRIEKPGVERLLCDCSGGPDDD